MLIKFSVFGGGYVAEGKDVARGQLSARCRQHPVKLCDITQWGMFRARAVKLCDITEWGMFRARDSQTVFGEQTELQARWAQMLIHDM